MGKIKKLSKKYKYAGFSIEYYPQTKDEIIDKINELIAAHNQKEKKIKKKEKIVSVFPAMSWEKPIGEMEKELIKVLDNNFCDVDGVSVNKKHLGEVAKKLLSLFKRFAGEVIGEDEKEAQNFWSGSTEAEKQIELLKQRRNDLRKEQRKTLNNLTK